MMKITMTLLIFSFACAPLFAQADKSGKAADKRGGGPNGYGSLQWGATLASTKEGVSGKITFVDEKRIIISREGDIEYRYGFFFQDPSIQDAAAAPPDEKKAPGKNEEKAPAQRQTEAKLYYVLMRFPYLHMDEVKKKIASKYGEPTGETIKNNQGALIWDFEKTSIIMWVDEYEKNPFCRKITYIGKDLAKDVNDYQKKVFTGKELEILRTLNP